MDMTPVKSGAVSAIGYEGDLALTPVAAPGVPAVIITDQQVEVIRKTIAADATDAELQLFFYDCRRRGVHPLDRLIHFTKRKGKYAPVTSIDFFRMRAGGTREHMGTDDAVFCGLITDGDFRATVTVYRLVQGEKCPFTATARWTEYLPEPPNDFMWKKMPHGQLAKCAEALALRKGFPQELADLHTFEEMAQADNATPPADARQVQRASEKKAQTPAPPVDNGTGVLITAPSKVKDLRHAQDSTGKTFYALTLVGDEAEYRTRNAKQAVELEQFKGTDHLVRISFKKNVWRDRTYNNVESFAVADADVKGAASNGAIDGELGF
jgi:phage recombination protein Bet